MTNLRIKAIPTEYGGIEYRSKTEARWFAMFDQIGWQVQYEPEGTGSWLPDGVILDGGDILIEIKPITSSKRSELNKYRKKIRDALWGTVRPRALLLIQAPIRIDGKAFIGWFAELGWDESYELDLVWTEAFLCEDDQNKIGLTGKPIHYRKVFEWWAVACNETKWNPRK